MAKQPSEISAEIRAKLSVTDPAMSLEIGTPERKIVDAVAESIAESQIDAYIVSTQLNIDTKSGIELEEYVGIFGFGRLRGRAATGTVSFRLPIKALNDQTIQLNTSIFVPATAVSTQLNFITTQTGYIAKDYTTVTLPARAVLIGSSGNVPSGVVSGYSNSVGFASVTNPVPFTGGTDDETDNQLRDRFKKTFLRNIAGTEDFYLALVLQANVVSRAKVIGPYNNFFEMLQFNGGAAVASTNTNSKYVWPDGWALSQNRSSSNEIYYTSAVDYVVNRGANPCTITPSNPALTGTDAFGYFEYQYTSKTSRNDPVNGITNKVDIFMDGVQAVGVQENVVIPSTNLTYGTGTGAFDAVKFNRVDAVAMPGSGTYRVMRLASVPVVTYPATIKVGGTTYALGTHYVGIKDVTLMGGTERSTDSVLFHTGTQPSAGGAAVITYSYNRLPELLNSLVRQSKQITTDVIVHAAKYRYLGVSLLIVYDNNANISKVNTDINTAMTKFLTATTFGGWIQFSDIAQLVHNVPGVDNCRIAKVADGAPYAIASRVNGTNVATYTTDFKLDDNEVCALDTINIIRKSANTYSA